ncbi:hypothetical protein Tco_0085233 [Tanacetum coccineum]
MSSWFAVISDYNSLFKLRKACRKTDSCKPLRDNMADENVPAPAPTRSNDQIILFAAWVPIGKSNFFFDLQKKQRNLIFQISLDEDWFILDANLLREALEITPVDQAHQFVSPPSGDAIMDFVNQLGYLGEIHFVSRMTVNNLYQPWRAILSMINQCLTGKTFGFDRPRYLVLQMLWGIITSTNVDYAELLNAPYYNAYMEMVTKHDKKITAEKGGKKKSASKADQSKKPTTAKQPKPVPSKGKVQKVCKGKSPLKLIDEDEEVHHEPKPQGVGEDYDLNRGIQMILETFQAHGQAPVGGVAIREQVKEATRQLPMVERKGKSIATDEQAAQSLLALHTPKRRSTMDFLCVMNGNPSRVNIKQPCGRSYALSSKPCQGDSLNLPDHRYKRRCCSLIPAESDPLARAHDQTTKTYYWHQDLRIKKAQVHTKTKTFANSNIQDLPLRYQVYQGRLLACFQKDAKYEHVGHDTRSQDGKDDKDKQGKDLKISESKTNSKDNDKG